MVNCLFCIGKCRSDVGRLRQHCSGLYFSYVGLMQAGLLLRSDTGPLCAHLQQLSKQVVTWQAGLPSSGLIQTYGCHLTKFPAQPPSLKPGCESWVGTGIYEGPQLEHLRTLCACRTLYPMCLQVSPWTLGGLGLQVTLFCTERVWPKTGPHNPRVGVGAKWI